MKNTIKFKNKIMPLIASMTLLSGPVLLVTACNNELSRYPAALPNDMQNRILFAFNNVSYNVDAKSQFSAALKQGMTSIKKEVEGIMAQQYFIDFFVEKLGYDKLNAEALFEQVKDNIGLNILANDYFNTITNEESFDTKVINANKLIFQTENWYQFGTTKFNYQKSDFYSKKENDPNTIFTSQYLYSELQVKAKDDQIKKVAKYADKNYNNEINKLTGDSLTWDSPSTQAPLPDPLGNEQDAISQYQKKLERFKWWLRFRYQQYYQSKILPDLNETLFTMANILNSILKISSDSSNGVKIQIDNSNYAQQLQDWGPTTWESKFRLVWDYTTSKSNADKINKSWDKDSALPNLMIKDTKDLNPDFFNKLKENTELKTIDPIIGINGYISNSTGKEYDSSLSKNVSGWANNNDGTHFWGKKTKGTFAYTAPLFWIDVVQNLNFNYYNNKDKEIIIDTTQDYKGLISIWNSSENNNTSNSEFSKYIRQDEKAFKDPYYQEMKWNIFWQMLYMLSSQEDNNSNREVAKSNFDIAAKALYPKYIKKENIYNSDFWDAINSYY